MLGYRNGQICGVQNVRPDRILEILQLQRAEVALSGGEGKTVIEIDAPRDRALQAGEIVSLQPRRYRIFAAQD